MRRNSDSIGLGPKLRLLLPEAVCRLLALGPHRLKVLETRWPSLGVEVVLLPDGQSHGECEDGAALSGD